MNIPNTNNPNKTKNDTNTDVNYENLAAEVIACAIKDYKRLNRSLKKATKQNEIERINFELKRIERFLLSGRFNFTEMSGSDLLALAKKEDDD